MRSRAKATRPRSDAEKERTKDAFKEFLDQLVHQTGKPVSNDVETNIKYWMGEIDKKLTAQLNEIWYAPPTMVISPIKPLRGGIPIELSAAIKKKIVKSGITRSKPPYSEISRVCRRS